MITVFFPNGTRLKEALEWFWTRDYTIQINNFRFHDKMFRFPKSYTGSVLVDEIYLPIRNFELYK